MRPEIESDNNRGANPWLEQLVGHWVEISAFGTSGFNIPMFAVGFVQEVNDYSMLVRKVDGEVMFLPCSSVLSARIVDPEDTSEAGRLLRPSAAPESESLLRPAGSGSEADIELLLKPSEPEIGH